MAKPVKEDAVAAGFREAVAATGQLQWRAGLQAVKKSKGGGQITCDDPRKLLGGAAIDDDCLAKHPSANRWDYVLGCRRTRNAVAFFIEVHSAETSAVSKLADKLAWLQTFLQQDAQQKLAGLTREFHWVASGRINIPKHVPQYRFLSTTLRTRGLKGPSKQLTLA